jgi:hypothetical protein
MASVSQRANGHSSGALDDVERAIGEVEAAAGNWGIRRDHPEGHFVTALLVMMRSFARILEEERQSAARRDERLGAMAEEVKKAGEAELEKVRELRKAVEALAQEAKVAMRDAEIRYDEAFTRQVQHIGKKMISEFAEWRVIVEGAWNRKMKWKWASVACLLTLLVAGTGYGFREWQDRGILQAVARCRESPDMIVPKTGEGGCLVAKLVARETSDVVEDWGKKLKGLWPFGS